MCNTWEKPSLKHYAMKLNPKKCTFSIKSGTFFGYIIDKQRVKVNLGKDQAILRMKSPTTVNEVQKLTDCIVVPRQLMLRLTDKRPTFFKVLNKKA